MSGHTPAPWEAKTREEWEQGFDFFAGESGAFVFMADVGSEDIPLINAAPDLLAAAKLAMEGVDVLDLLMASIEKHGNYSEKSTLHFLNQARCARLRLTEAIAKAEAAP